MLGLDEVFRGRGAQLRVAEYMAGKGIGVDDSGSLVCAGVELKHNSLAKVLSVDRRVVNSTIETILGDERLSKIFKSLDSTVYLRDTAPLLGFGVFEVVPSDAAAKGIVAGVTKVLIEEGLGIRQLVADDPMFDNPELTVVTDKPIDKKLLDRLLRVEGVKEIVVLN
ncbi:MAG TPA: amino acid-binding protein [Candidatus Altiarchaeales archaeon]|nr:amino acid-binding protein [Candidatus Altiarchaeales archaeon]